MVRGGGVEEGPEVTSAGEELMVGTGFDDAAGDEDDDGVNVAQGGQPVGDDEGGALASQAAQGVLNELLTVGIDGGSGFVENEDRGVA
jgi:hypothetical protein